MAFGIEIKDRGKLIEKFCAADSNFDTVVILPAALSVDAEQMICPSGPYKLYRIVEATDTDDFEYFWIHRYVVAINCRPLK